MRIDPAIAALRGDRAPQRRAQAAMAAACEAWRAEPAVAPVLADLERFGAGEELAQCSALDALFTRPGGAGALVDALCRQHLPVLRESPFGHPVFRHGYDGEVSTLLLARAGRAHLVLHALEPGRREFASAGFSDAVRFEAVLAGEAEARVVRRDAAQAFAFEPMQLRDGVCLGLDLTREALQVTGITRRLVALRLHRFASSPGPSREYTLPGGALLQQASGDLRASRHEMMLATLGRMGRCEAAPEMAAMAREPGEESLRWQALRECLALDTEAGFRALLDLASRKGDPLAAHAEALRAQLLELHPQLHALEEPECLA